MHKLVLATLALAMGTPLGAAADTAADVTALRQEMDAMRARPTKRGCRRSRRKRIAEGWAGKQAGRAGARCASACASASAGRRGPVQRPRSPRCRRRRLRRPRRRRLQSGDLADPAGQYATPRATPHLRDHGFRCHRWRGRPGTRGFSLAESELGLTASIDPVVSGAANMRSAPTTASASRKRGSRATSLGGGLTLKAGRFFSGIGYLNEQHAHTWDFVDAPLAYQAFFGTQQDDDGLQLRWVAPTDRFVELGAEIGRGAPFPGSDGGRNGIGMTALFAHAGDDIGASGSWRVGVSLLERARPTIAATATQRRRHSGHQQLQRPHPRPGASTRIYKWAPERQCHAAPTSCCRASTCTASAHGNLARWRRTPTPSGDYSATQTGWYLQAVYQFMPRWRVGARYDRLDSGTPRHRPSTAGPGAPTYRHRAAVAHVADARLRPSEFSRLRLQLGADRAREGLTDRQIFLQYIMSLGAHGAHTSKEPAMQHRYSSRRCSPRRVAGAAGARRAQRRRLRARMGRARQELGGDKVNVSVATTALQDPHQIQARPSLIARMRDADLLVCTGAELEVGWLPILLQQAGNAVQPGAPGNFEAAASCAARGAALLDRARATCTPPAIRTSRPIRATSRSRRRAGRPPAQLDPANAADYRKAADFSRAGARRCASWAAQAAPLRDAGRGPPQELGLSLGLARRARGRDARAQARCGAERRAPAAVLATARASRRSMVLYARLRGPARLRMVRRERAASGSRAAVHGRRQRRASDLFGLFDDTVERLLARRAASHELECGRRDPLPGVSRRPARARDARAARHARARARHRLHRPGDRAGRGPRRDRRRRDGWPRAGGGAGRGGLAALLGALLLTWTERAWPEVQEALIGVVFVLAASGGILLLAKQSARRRALEGFARRPDPLGRLSPAAVAARRGRACCWRCWWAGASGWGDSASMACSRWR